MTSLKTYNDELKIFYHKVTNKIDDSFVGIKIKNKQIDFYYPETYDFDEDSLENNRNDVIAILNTISIAKTHSGSDLKIESSFSNNEALPLLSYLWIIKDYLQCGFYINREKVFKKNQHGKVDWKRTLNQKPIVSNGNIIYNNLIVSVNDELDNLLVEIHKYCVKKSLELLGWLFNINDASFINALPYQEDLKDLYIYALKKELSKTFDDKKKERLEHMLSIVEGLSEEQQAKEVVYGVDSYAYIYERMINSIFGNREAAEFNPSAKWFLKINNYDSFKSSDLRPDTIMIKNNIAYVLDAKFYRFGYTSSKDDLPETTSIQKQITYGDYIKNNKVGKDILKIRNAFILPYNMNNNKFNLHNTIEYLGYAKTDYRKGIDEHEIIHAFLIDLKFVINNWNNNNSFNVIKDLVEQIESIQNTIIKSEKEKEYKENIVPINDKQSFKGSILSSFYATIYNQKLKDSLVKEQILYVDGFFVINDKKYVDLKNNKLSLTSYALNNMNECCLAFDSEEVKVPVGIETPFCENCEVRKKIKTNKINPSSEHNKKVFIRANDSDIERVLINNKEDSDYLKMLVGTPAEILEKLMHDNGFTAHSLYQETRVDNKKIGDFTKGSSKPSLKQSVAFCAAFELRPMVSHYFLKSMGYYIQTSHYEYEQFYDFLITYCSGETLHEWQVKIANTGHLEWQIP